MAGKYLIDSVLGVGGMGVVFRARHLEIDAPVALKFLSAEFRENAQAIGRFRREAQAAAKLRSEHVVRVFDVGLHTNGLPYMVMEYLEGKDLGRLIRNGGALSVEQAANLLVQTCGALEDAHRRGIIHRDLKPSNLFCVPLDGGGYSIKVVDFGISKVTGDAANVDQGITVTGNIVGSPSYMSPEQMKNSSGVDRRTDIWSLGVVLYECVTGKVPFPGDTYAEVCLRVHQDPPLPPEAHGVEIPPALGTVIMKCLAKDPEQRFASAAALADALLSFTSVPARTSLGPLPSSAPAERKGSFRGRFGLLRSTPGIVTSTLPTWANTPPPSSGRRRPALLLAAGLVLVASVALLLLGYGPTAPIAPMASPSGSVDGIPAASPPPATQPIVVAPIGPPPVESVATAVAPATSTSPALSSSAASSPLVSPPAASSRVAPPAAVSSRPASPPAPGRTRKSLTERDSKSSVWAR